MACFFCAVILLRFMTASAEPSCKDTSSDFETSYTCEGFNKPGDFDNYVDRPFNRKALTFILEDCRLSYLPYGAFVDINVTLLELINVTLMTSFDASPLKEVERTLERIAFSYNSTLPESWAALQIVPRLKTLSFSKMHRLNLTEDFNNLPQTVRGISIVYSTIERITEHWLSELRNLEYIVIRDSKLQTFSRSMLPRPAPRLRNIDLNFNEISEIHPDFDEDLPALVFLDLEGNRITSLKERSVGRLLNGSRTLILLGQNPLHCDCRLAFLRSSSERRLRARCETPEAVKGRQVQTLSDQDMRCPLDA
ncbi:secreted protein, putative [Ixodes scapularis]|uniref:Secreted protein, putative n=1 Tax=Ixodes scapularis TaxID=6945 RepID=B7PUY8_IXOSC|nr:secreted protein, putative [Ixodes scapularis]|eukprot:XP_002406977.1 secreted protein, putative [Ixodes scapularis]